MCDGAAWQAVGVDHAGNLTVPGNLAVGGGVSTTGNVTVGGAVNTTGDVATSSSLVAAAKMRLSTAGIAPTEGGDCSAHGTGSMARDASGNFFICK